MINSNVISARTLSEKVCHARPKAVSATFAESASMITTEVMVKSALNARYLTLSFKKYIEQSSNY